jgi:hypothetical protein
MRVVHDPAELLAEARVEVAAGEMVGVVQQEPVRAGGRHRNDEQTFRDEVNGIDPKRP